MSITAPQQNFLTKQAAALLRDGTIGKGLLAAGGGALAAGIPMGMSAAFSPQAMGSLAGAGSGGLLAAILAHKLGGGAASKTMAALGGIGAGGVGAYNVLDDEIGDKGNWDQAKIGLGGALGGSATAALGGILPFLIGRKGYNPLLTAKIMSSLGGGVGTVGGMLGANKLIES